MLIEIGRLATIWAEIEQFLILDVSALTAVDGVPTGHLRIEFRRLREEWIKSIKDKLGDRYFDKVCNPINQRLVDASESRGMVFHGTWRAVKRGSYRVEWHEQKRRLVWFSIPISLQEMRDVNSGLHKLLTDLKAARS